MNKALALGLMFLCGFSGSVMASCYPPLNSAYGMNFTSCISKSGLANSTYRLGRVLGKPSYDAYKEDAKCVKELEVEGGKEFKSLKACLKKSGNRDGVKALSDLYGAWSALIDSLIDVSGNEYYSEDISKKEAEVRRLYKVLEFNI